ncbi:malto-oligosyltrehalose synthase [Marinivivus vitaminiproducens]|uniref:malto-oligosyltrehalose synthase n=1 Tax=Marinivivus vitaminiproducens TaxID=3035935 RepID=UPI0027A5FFFD|nr:malto-oligosyltrehalose synthase [Geminicoccaceae bacterium SCSIO 64248]
MVQTNIPPRATLRLQFGPELDFAQARALLPYAKALGISHIYASPILQAREGSTHGYDVANPRQVSEDLGGEPGFDDFVQDLRRLGLGLIIDIVPNHMGIGADNAWWMDVLEHGQASAYAGYFDIDWARGQPEGKAGKLVLPMLGDSYGNVLERGELKLEFDARSGRFGIRYFDHDLPVSPLTYADLLRRVDARLPSSSFTLNDLAQEFASSIIRDAANRVASVSELTTLLQAELAELVVDRTDILESIIATVDEINTPNGEGQRPALQIVIDAQFYRLIYWRAAGDEINYRRFFEIDELASIRVEQPEVFAASHSRALAMVGSHAVHGLRIDHIDGLYDPEGYLERLQTAARKRQANVPDLAPGQALYVVVEKILGEDEHLPGSWQAAGTTGYEFMNDVLGVMIDRSAEPAFDALYQEITGETADFATMVLRAKRARLTYDFAADLRALVERVHNLADRSPYTCDITLNALHRALVEVTIELPVYRTYAGKDGCRPEDLAIIRACVERASERLDVNGLIALDFLQDVLSLSPHVQARSRKGELLDLVRRWQQLTGPVMAKSVEDTSFYRFQRMVALNEVGGEPERFGMSVEDFHERCAERAERFPNSMIATATHDHKRGEDTRARLAVLSEMPETWRTAALEWLDLLDDLPAGGEPSLIGPRTRYLFVQVLLGIWPFGLTPDDAEPFEDLAERMVAFMLKAAREAKEDTAWTDANQPYEQSLEAFVRTALDPEKARPFLQAVGRLAAEIAPAGVVKSLTQTLLRVTAPGVPDTYQGCDLWDFSLVDPDNRRPVDWALRRHLLGQRTPPEELLQTWTDGRIKQRLMSRVLHVRADVPDLFAHGRYVPLEVTGPAADRVMAFARIGDEVACVTVVPRLAHGLLAADGLPRLDPAALDGTEVVLPEDMPGPLQDIVTGQSFAASGRLKVADLLTAWPVACLIAA